MSSNKYLIFSAIGFELVGIILTCIFIGHYLDQTYGWKGLGLIGLTVAGLVGWLVHVIHLLRRLEAADSDEKP